VPPAAQAAVLVLPAPADDLVVRAWQPGDRMRLPGGSGRKKVQDVFVDRKVPRAQRHLVPIVTAADGRILWVIGHAVAGGFGVTEATKSVVVLSFEPLGGN
jgi:tRNA(Ile)-lysidine synthase